MVGPCQKLGEKAASDVIGQSLLLGMKRQTQTSMHMSAPAVVNASAMNAQLIISTIHSIARLANIDNHHPSNAATVGIARDAVAVGHASHAEKCTLPLDMYAQTVTVA